jgi:hypothetical protein
VARNPFLVACASVLVLAACGDTDLPTEEKSSLVLFKRVTIAADAPGRAEIEIEVRTGPHLSQPVSDGTSVILETSAGRFANGAKKVQLSTAGSSRRQVGERWPSSRSVGRKASSSRRWSKGRKLGSPCSCAGMDRWSSEPLEDVA